MADKPIRFATFLAPNMLSVYRFIAEYVAKQLGYPTELVVGESFDEFAQGKADVGFICGLPYVQLADQPDRPVEPLAAPVLAGDRYEDRPIYFSDVIVRRDSPFQTFADLRGHSWSFNDPASHSGFNVTRYWLAQMGEQRGYFSKIVQAGFHQRSIAMVGAGEIDASAIDTQVLAIEMREHPALTEQLRVIETLGPSPIQPVVAARRLPDSLKADIRAAILDMGCDPAAQTAFAHGFIKRFVTISDADYNPIRDMLVLAEGVDFAPTA